jgi:hypothetical protein
MHSGILVAVQQLDRWRGRTVDGYLERLGATPGVGAKVREPSND